jgi:hypothetical protein
MNAKQYKTLTLSDSTKSKLRSLGFRTTYKTGTTGTGFVMFEFLIDQRTNTQRYERITMSKWPVRNMTPPVVGARNYTTDLNARVCSSYYGLTNSVPDFSHQQYQGESLYDTSQNYDDLFLSEFLDLLLAPQLCDCYLVNDTDQFLHD